ncbi:MAG: hypothetical protein RI909_275 [Bacteroidota bacterium]
MKLIFYSAVIFFSMTGLTHAQQTQATKIEIIKLAGDRDNEGLYTVRQRIPAGHFGPPHYHSSDYYITVLKGKVRIGYGEKIDTVGVKPIEIGTFFIIPAGKIHYEWFTEDTELQVHGLGPVKTVMVKPKETH